MNAWEFAASAMEEAAGTFERGGLVVPFAVVVVGADGEAALEHCDSEEAARQLVRDTAGVTLAAVAWDGFVDRQGVRTEAVFVEVSAADADGSVILVQQYDAGARRGEPIVVRTHDALF